MKRSHCYCLPTVLEISCFSHFHLYFLLILIVPFHFHWLYKCIGIFREKTFFHSSWIGEWIWERKLLQNRREKITEFCRAFFICTSLTVIDIYRCLFREANNYQINRTIAKWKVTRNATNKDVQAQATPVVCTIYMDSQRIHLLSLTYQQNHFALLCHLLHFKSISFLRGSRCAAVAGMASLLACICLLVVHLRVCGHRPDLHFVGIDHPGLLRTAFLFGIPIRVRYLLLCLGRNDWRVCTFRWIQLSELEVDLRITSLSIDKQACEYG